MNKLWFFVGLLLCWASSLRAQEEFGTPSWLGNEGPGDAWTAAQLESDAMRLKEGTSEVWTVGGQDDGSAPEAPVSAEISSEEASTDEEGVTDSGEHAEDGSIDDDPGEDAEELEPPKKVEPIEFVPGKTCVSLGKANNGALINGVPLNSNDYITSMKTSRYGTPELVEAIQAAAEAVNRKYPGSHKVIVRDLSAREGGPLKPHLSHQAGCDVDIGYYFKDRVPQGFVEATPRNLDAARTWTLVESFLADGKTEYIFMDYSIQKPLYEYARDVAHVSPARLTKIFSYPHGKRYGIIRDAKGHKNHLHVRIWCPQAKAAVRDYVKRYGNSALKPLPVYYTVKRGDNPSKIAKKHKIKLEEFKKWNDFKKRKRKTLKPGEKMIVGYKRPKLPGM